LQPVPSETEVTLAIRSDSPEEVIHELESLREICDYALVAKPTQRLRDQYFESPAGELESKGFALRLRTVGEDSLITLKGAPTAQGPAIRRLEIEGSPGCQKTLSQIQDVLSQQSLSVDLRRVVETGDPVSTLERAGWSVIQDRETCRRIRDVSPSRERSVRPLAELVIDSVAYRAGEGEVYHHEVEIEEKGKAGSEVLEKITVRLLDSFGQVLKPWPHSKLATGRAIQQLVREVGRERVCTPRGHLNSGGYERLELFLAGGSCQ
jgi:hypothetical protein